MDQHNKKLLLTGVAVAGFCMIAIICYFYLNSLFVFKQAAITSAPSDILSKQQVDESLNIAAQQGGTGSLPATIIIGCSLEVTGSKSNPTNLTTAYVVNIKNTGTQLCQNTSMSTYYTAGEKFISATPNPVAANYYWVLGQLASGASVQVAFTTNKPASNTEQTESCITADNARQDSCTTYGSVVLAGNFAPESEVLPEPEPIHALLQPAQSSLVLDKKENGVWVWKSPIAMNQDYRDFILNTSIKNNFNAVYVTVDDYLAIAAMAEGKAKNDKKKKYMDALELLIKQASQKGIAVDAEAGWRDWAEPANTYKPFAIIDFVKEYNATRIYKLRALQYDIEPYLMPSYERNKAVLLKNFVALIDQTVTRLEGHDVAFNVVIPHFYDEAQKWTPSFTYNKTTTFTFNHLLNILERKSGSSIILMSYRNFADGPDSTIEISKAEIEKATNGNYRTQVIVAQETGNVAPDYVTFFATSKNYFIGQGNIIKETFLPYRNFGGMATHYLEPFAALEQ